MNETVPESIMDFVPRYQEFQVNKDRTESLIKVRVHLFLVQYISKHSEARHPVPHTRHGMGQCRMDVFPHCRFPSVDRD